MVLADSLADCSALRPQPGCTKHQSLGGKHATPRGANNDLTDFCHCLIVRPLLWFPPRNSQITAGLVSGIGYSRRSGQTRRWRRKPIKVQLPGYRDHLPARHPCRLQYILAVPGPTYSIYDLGRFPANRRLDGTTTNCCRPENAAYHRLRRQHQPRNFMVRPALSKGPHRHH